MCGICGFIKFDNEKAQEAPIREMMRIQKHRGPDDEGVFVEDNVGLGFVRLSILDLSPAGHQPMYSRDGRFVVVFNGEIFNYVELRDELKKHGYEFSTGTDTEVLLAAYQHWG
jgi:asparagine synthase (glutamine-hydrolysing)